MLDKLHSVTVFTQAVQFGPFSTNWSLQILSPVTILQVVAVNENVFSVNLPGKIRVKSNKYILTNQINYFAYNWVKDQNWTVCVDLANDTKLYITKDYILY